MRDFNRREFLAATAAVTTTPIAWAEDRIDIRPIDAHVHVWSSDTESYPLAEGFQKNAMKPSSFTAEQLFAHSKPNGVSRIVLIQMSFYQYDNRYMLDTMERYPGVFAGVAIVDDSKSDVAARMFELAKQGVRGFRLYANEANTSAWASDRGVKTMWRAGAEHNLAMCLLADPESLPAIDKMCAQFPETPVVIDHFARISMKGAVDPMQLDRLLALARFDNVHVKLSAFYALGRKTPPYLDLVPMIRKLRDAFGAQRLMWATDCPFQVESPHTYRASIELIRDHLDFLNPGEKRCLLETTAEKIFF